MQPSKLDFAAADSAVGYLYQLRLGLLLLLRTADDDAVLSIELLDDITLEFDSSQALYSLKHHREDSSITDGSPDLWKTLRIWSERIAKGQVNTSAMKLILASTAVAPPNSIGALLRDDEHRNVDVALRRLTAWAKEHSGTKLNSEGREVPKNAALDTAFKSFLALDDFQRYSLVEAVYLADSSPRIEAVGELIEVELRNNARQDSRAKLQSTLEGWWFKRVLAHLTGTDTRPISRAALTEHLMEFMRDYVSLALPVPHRATPFKRDEFSFDKRFVRQLKSIELQPQRIDHAARDFFRASKQRNQWAEDTRLIEGELDTFDSLLTEEWERQQSKLLQSYKCSKAHEVDDIDCVEFGQKLFDNVVDKTPRIPIRDMYEDFLIRGSYHMLADDEKVGLCWHPKYSDI